MKRLFFTFTAMVLSFSLLSQTALADSTSIQKENQKVIVQLTKEADSQKSYMQREAKRTKRDVQAPFGERKKVETGDFTIDNQFFSIKKDSFCDSKQFKLTQTVNKDANFRISTQFSNIDILTWDKNEIDVTATIGVCSFSERNTQEVLEALSIELTGSKNDVVLKTIRKIKKVKNTRITIDIAIMVPKDIYMDVEASYGDITIDNVYKRFNLLNQYGDTRIGNLYENSEITVDYGDCTIDSLFTTGNIDTDFGSFKALYINNAEIDVTYGDARINKSDIIALNASFSNFTIGEVNSLDLNSQYNSGKINNVKSLNIKDGFSGISIAYLEENIKANISYSEIKLNEVGAHFTNININGDFSTIYVNLDESYSFKYKIDAGVKAPSYIRKNAEINKENLLYGKHNPSETMGEVDIEGSYTHVTID